MSRPGELRLDVYPGRRDAERWRSPLPGREPLSHALLVGEGKGKEVRLPGWVRAQPPSSGFLGPRELKAALCGLPW